MDKMDKLKGKKNEKNIVQRKKIGTVNCRTQLYKLSVFLKVTGAQTFLKLLSFYFVFLF